MRQRLALRMLAPALAASTFALAVIAPPATAGIEKAGTTSASFLTLGMGAGVLGMGGATLGMYGDLSGISWNVASLGRLSETQLAFSHAPLAGSGAQDAAVFGGRLGASSMHWALTGLYQGDGAFEGRDALGNSTGSFNASSMAFGATLARSIGPFASVGVGGKVVTEKLGDVSGFGGTFDAGLLVERSGFGFGVAAQNVGGRMQYGNIYYQMPTNIGAGVSFMPPMTGLRFALDYNHPTAYYDDVRGGVEWMWHGRVALRSGYRHEMGGASEDALNSPTFGMGAGVRGVWLDYGYIASSNGDGEHRISVRMSPRAWSVPGAGMLGAQDQEKKSPKIAEVVPPAPKKEATEKDAKKHAKSAGSPETTVKAAHSPAVATANPPVPAPVATTTAKPEPVTTKEAPVTKTTASAPSLATAQTTKPVTTTTSTKSMAPNSVTKPVAVASVPKPVAATSTTKPAVTTSATKPVATSSATKPTSTAQTSVPQAQATKPAPTVVAHTQTTKPVAAAGTSATPATSNEPAEAKVEKAPAATSTAPNASATESAPVRTKPAQTASATQTAAVQPAAPVEPAPAPSAPIKRPDKVHVKSGETMMSIARRYDTSVAAIMMENNLVSDQVKVGQTLKIPNHK